MSCPPPRPVPAARPGRTTAILRRLPRRSARARRRRGLALVAAGAATVAWGLVLAASTTRAAPALATVVHHQGFEATVLGLDQLVRRATTWARSAPAGASITAWPLPTPAFDYRPTTPTDLRDDTRAAMAWAVTSAGPAPTRSAPPPSCWCCTTCAAPSTPTGGSTSNTLSTAQLAGFAGHEGQVIAEAQAIKADALAHAARRGPLRLVGRRPRAPARRRVWWWSRSPTGGAPPSPGRRCRWPSTGATLGLASATTGPDGRLSAALRPARRLGHRRRRRAGPSSTPGPWRPTPPCRRGLRPRSLAQRIVTPSWLTLTAAADLAPPPTTTTTTAQPTTSTTRSPITTTTTRPRPTTTTSTTTVPTTTVPTTTVPTDHRPTTTTDCSDDHHRVEPGPGHRRAPQRPATHQPHPGARDQRGDPSTPGDRRLQPGLGHGGPGPAPDGLGAGGGGPRTEPPGVVGRLPRACLTMAAGHR